MGEGECEGRFVIDCVTVLRSPFYRHPDDEMAQVSGKHRYKKSAQQNPRIVGVRIEIVAIPPRPCAIQTNRKRYKKGD